MPLLKVCGITRADDAAAACKLGYDAIGMIFADSKRRVSPEQARDISRSLPASIMRVGVFVNQDGGEIRKLMEYCRLDLVQLHGEESPEEVASFGAKAIKALRPRSLDELTMLEAYPNVFAILLDTWDEALRGGTGKTCDWELARSASEKRRIILAGGLSPSNVEQAIAQVRPFGVDVCSGVEFSPKIKDREMIREFARKARAGFSSSHYREADHAEA
jgi:phosphoribosylanthranilate isomerase